MRNLTSRALLLICAGVLLLAAGISVSADGRRGPDKSESLDGLLYADPRWMSDAELQRLAEIDPTLLGSLSVGSVSNGVLINAVPMPADPRWDIIDPRESWGTRETIGFITAAVAQVHSVFADTPPLFIGDISRQEGGRLNRHDTHQTGRDVDLGFYYKKGRGWWHAAGSSRNLDISRNWTLVRALLTCTDLECVLLDIRIQKLLVRYARAMGEDEAWLNKVFQYPSGRRKALIRHVSGHRTHYHVRFYNRRAQALARRAYPILLRMERIKPSRYHMFHKVRPGETLGHLADRYRTSVRAIRLANGLKGNLIRAGRTYRIPCRGASSPPAEALVVPERSLPPFTPEGLQAAEWPEPGRQRLR
jgi:murein endopeptidase